VGNYLEMPVLAESPIDPDAIEYMTSESIGGEGHLLGTVLDFTMRKQTWDFKWIVPAWITGTWIPFRDAHTVKPFFWVWDYATYPAAVYLMRFSNKDRKAPWEAAWRDVSFELEGVCE
jgi:hypothetical protein